MEILNQLLSGIIIGFFVAKIFNFINNYKSHQIAKKRDLEKLMLEITLERHKRRIELKQYYNVLFLVATIALIKASKNKQGSKEENKNNN
ncbi:hypothetical protein [Flavobacterium sp. J27]|uniref:hypothetical protein n=1 Tax=Flavobacterium sp. J27 TaxID=2060419 RepID=UPI00102F5F22|nr:hypothetical protein [Flavobacterium sp. J27]